MQDPSSRSLISERSAGEVIVIVQHWLDRQTNLFPGFAGAYLFGSIIHQPPDATFPSYRDVDLIIVLSEGSSLPENMEVFEEGVMMEIGFQPMERLAFPASVLSDPELATNFAVTRILSDPLGVLTPLQNEVANQFSRREWLQARCAAEMKFVQRGMHEIANAGSFFEKTLALWNTCSCLSGLVALACLRPPTHRRSLVQSQNLLAEHQHLDLQEKLLRLWGSETLTHANVQELLLGAIQMFDRAVEVHHTPVPFGFKLRAHLRPYFMDAVQEMIDEGFHREATFWIALPNSIGYLAILADGNEADQQMAIRHYEQFWTAMQLRTAEEVNLRAEFARQVAREAEQFAEEMVVQYGT